MADQRPPTIDPVAAARWDRVAPAQSPWLHEEVARRMEDRLQWIRLQPQAWADWEPVRGGLARPCAAGAPLSAAPSASWPKPGRACAWRATIWHRPWWRRWSGPALHHGPVPQGAVQMLWANMALHMSAQPQTLIAQWHRALAVDGFLMFSCLGPDTLRELRAALPRAGLAAAGA